MRFLVRCLALLITIAALHPSAYGQAGSDANYSLKADGIQLILDKRGSVRSTWDGHKSEVCPLISLFDGNADDRRILSLQPTMTACSTKECRYTFQLNDPKLFILAKAMASGKYIAVNITIQNTGKKQARIKPSVNIPLPYSDNSITYWDGDGERKDFTGKAVKDEMYNAFKIFPAAAVYNADYGFAIGFDAEHYYCYLEPSIDYGAEKKVLSWATKLVIEPGQKEEVRFLVYGFTPDYGYLNAIDRYQSIFSEYFMPAKGTDSRLVGTCEASNECDDEDGGLYEYESQRRCFASMSWWYGPWKKSGSFWGIPGDPQDEAEWAVKIEHEDKLLDRYKRPLKDFNVQLGAKFTRGMRNGILPMYYVLNYCEEGLAHRKYSDYILKHDDGSIDLIDGWVRPWSDDIQMWWGGRYEKDIKKALSAVVQSCNITGFSIDCAHGGWRARENSGVDKTTPGRSYDEQGVYAEKTISIARMMKFMHTQKKGNMVMGTYANFGNYCPYYIAFNADCQLVEANFADISSEMPMFQKTRYLVGKKPRLMFALIGREDYYKTVDWEKMTPEEIKTFYRDKWDTGILSLFRLGILPSSSISYGYVSMMKSLPALTTLVKAGYESVPAVKLDKEFWTARYGDGLGSYIFIGNQEAADRSARAVLDNKHFGDGNYIFCAYDGREFANAVANGQTKLDISLAPKKYIVLKAMARIYGDVPVDGRISEVSTVSGGVISASLTSASTANTRMSVRVPEDGIVTAVRVNDKPVKFSTGNGEVSFAVTLGSGSKVVVDWKSRTFKSPADAILDFPFVSADNQTTCSIVVADKADEWDVAAAERLQGYFRAYFKEVKGQDVRIPVKTQSQIANSGGYRVLIGYGKAAAKTGSISVQGDSLSIDAPDSSIRYELVSRLMRVLDEKYVNYGTIGAGFRRNWLPEDPKTLQMREKAGLGMGGVLD